MTNYSVGNEAENVAAEYLANLGYKIIYTNWRTKYCEIDIIAEKDSTINFVEVKYRKSSVYGSGLDYITPKKLKQMKFSAEMWVSQNNWAGDYQLAALEITGPSFEITNFLTTL